VASELFAEGGPDVAITLTPGGGGVLEVKMNGEVVYDKASETGKTPDLNRVKEIRAQLKSRIEAA
jgi:predicted Rdx family selenoprotein